MVVVSLDPLIISFLLLLFRHPTLNPLHCRLTLWLTIQIIVAWWHKEVGQASLLFKCFSCMHISMYLRHFSFLTVW